MPVDETQRLCFNPYMQTDAYIALGSNQGDRELYLLRAIAEIGRTPGCKVIAISPFYETSPVGVINQPNFYNGVIRVVTSRTPHELMDILLQVESALGRVRTTRWSERTIDLDLLLYGELVSNEPVLTLPHPRLHQRRFVLQPFCDIGGDVVHPLFGVTIGELLEQLKSDEIVTKI